MADESLDILVKTTGDPAGAAAVGAALDDVNKKTGQGTEKNEEHARSWAHAESSGRAFHQLLHGITQGSEEAGLALRAMLGPVGAAIGGAALILRHFNAEIEESKKHAAELAAAFAKPFGDMRASIIAARQEVAMLQIDYDHWAKSVIEHSGEISKATTLAITDLHTQTEATKELAKAQLEAAKAQVQASIMPEDEKRVKLAGLDRSAMALESKTDREARAAEAKIVADQLADATRKRDDAAKAVQDAEANAEAVKGRAKGQDLPKQIESLKEIIALHDQEYQRLQAIADKERDQAKPGAKAGPSLILRRMRESLFNVPTGEEEKINRLQEDAQAEADLAAANRKKLEQFTAAQQAHEQDAKVTAAELARTQAKAKELETEIQELEERKKALDHQIAIQAQFQPAIDAAKAAAASAKLFTDIQSGKSPLASLETAAQVAGSGQGGKLAPAVQAFVQDLGRLADSHADSLAKAAAAINKLASAGADGQNRLIEIIEHHIQELVTSQNALERQLATSMRSLATP